jgi:hypothetical protein
MRKLLMRRAAGVRDSMPCAEPQVRRRRLATCHAALEGKSMAGSPLLTTLTPQATTLTAALLVLAVSAVAHAQPLPPKHTFLMERSCTPGSSCFTLVACDGALYSACYKACIKSPQNPEDPPQSSIQKSYHCNKDCNSKSGCNRR